MRLYGTLLLALATLAACEDPGSAGGDPGDETTDDTDASITTEGGTTGSDTSPDPTDDATTGSSTGDPTDDPTDDPTETGGPTKSAGYCAIVRGPVDDGDDFGAVYLLDDSLDAEALLPTSGQLFVAPSGRRFAHVENGAVWVYDIDAGTHTRVSEDAVVEDISEVIQWAPTGEALVYRVEEPMGPSGETVYGVRADGTGHALLSGTAQPWRTTFGEGNVAAALERPVEGGPMARIKLLDLDADVPAAIEADVIPGVDECAADRPIAPCGDGVLAVVGDCSARDLYHVRPDGTATAVTNDGMDAVAVGCSPENDVAVYSRNLDLFAAPLDGSAEPTAVSGKLGYAGDGARIVDTGEKSSGYLYYESMGLMPVIERFHELGEASVPVIEEAIDFEVPPVTAAIFAMFTYAAEQVTGYVGGVGTDVVNEVYQTMPNERIIDRAVVPHPQMPDDPSSASLFLLTDRQSTGFNLLGFRGDGTAFGGDGLVLGALDQTPFECVEAGGGVLICLTEGQAATAVGLLLVDVALAFVDEQQALEEELLNPTAQPYGFTLLPCKLEF